MKYSINHIILEVETMAVDKAKIQKAFNDLSVRYGGSIFGKKKRLNQNTVTVFIGLGGLGCRAVNTIKKVTNEKLDNPDRRFFLAVDTCEKDLDLISAANITDLKNVGNEIADASVHGCIDADEKLELYTDSFKIKKLGHDIDTWIDREIFGEVTIDKEGAQQVRQIGRVFLYGNSNTYDKVTNKVTEVLNGARNKAEQGNIDVKVYIIAGLGGGTGSGTIVDFSFIVRKAMRTFALKDKRVEGILFTPDVQENDRGVTSNRYDSIQVNFYAAIKEIDYFYNNVARHKKYIAPNGDEFEEDIYDECTLVSRIADGEEVARNSDELISILANALAFELGDINGITADGGKESYDYDAFYYTVSSSYMCWYLQNSNGQGLDIPDYLPAKYNSFGYSSFYIPRDELLAYSANKLLEKLVDHWTIDDVTENEINKILTRFSLRSNRMFAGRLFELSNCGKNFDVENKELPTDGVGPFL